ncbi:hypothetical protein N7468_003984 [Penicillium chermesinum]|uniref:PPM-type phosphatase domain-containing protein n=1 Tax=Penicillium chermesinum TaxID=63820 RepID=A0A9W9TS46_9EURO|nr:uncharacterized protein N7468_003984 [Penicillium chermesinum]KAJ5239365.1 hypothetical protein N7468_003984 [Penicillium chermesinum]KAJ6164988.1 hypothetical protein N7470_003660 [Penicillium chermesinum]
MFSCYSTRARLPLSRVTRPNSRTYSTKAAGSKNWNITGAFVVSLALGTGATLWPRDKSKAPHLEATITQPLVAEKVLSREAVTSLISQHAYSISTDSIPGVVKYDGAQVASNQPCEDAFFHGQFPAPWQHNKQWMAWAVLDGHAGWQTSKLLETKLLPYVRERLTQLQDQYGQGPAPTHVVQDAITQGFLNLDTSIMKAAEESAASDEPLQIKAGKLAPAFAGSCALLSLFDPATSTLHVACTGDSRAVLGQQRPDGSWEAIPLSVDQTGRNAQEISRLQKEHPGEDNIVKGGRVLGLMVSRAFGDSRWKWPLEVQQEMSRRYYGPAPLAPRYDVRTPPYLTAEPVVTSTRIDYSRPTFLIMATDGLWDNMSSQQAVDVTGRWLEWRHGKEMPRQLRPAFADLDFDFGDFGSKLEEGFVEERETREDKNAAVHLVRNSLGGAHHELLAGRLAFRPPFSRNVRDDITVQVVVFQDHAAA